MIRFSQAYFITFKSFKIFVLCLMNSCRSSLTEIFFKEVISKFLECIQRNISTKDSDLSKVEPAELVKSLAIMGNFLKLFQVYFSQAYKSCCYFFLLMVVYGVQLLRNSQGQTACHQVYR